MKAIEILFDKIDELNAKIKVESQIFKKIYYADRIYKIIEVVNRIHSLSDSTENESYL